VYGTKQLCVRYIFSFLITIDFYVSYRYNILINIVLNSRLVYTVLNIDGARSVVGATTRSVTMRSHSHD
jgi:hypothetical protein